MGVQQQVEPQSTALMLMGAPLLVQVLAWELGKTELLNIAPALNQAFWLVFTDTCKHELRTYYDDELCRSHPFEVTPGATPAHDEPQ